MQCVNLRPIAQLQDGRALDNMCKNSLGLSVDINCTVIQSWWPNELMECQFVHMGA